MIEGLLIEVSSTELRKTLLERIAFHEKRVLYYKELAEKSIDEVAERAELSYSNKTVQGQKTEALNSADRHRRRAAFFKFLADHLISNEVYRLSEEDLSRLEVIDRYM